MPAEMLKIAAEPDIDESPAETDPLEERRQKITKRVRRYIDKTFYDLGIASSRETKAMEDGLRYLETEEQIREWERMCDIHIPEMEKSAKEMWGLFKDHLASAGKVLSDKGRDKWLRWFRDPTLDYKTKEGFIKYKMKSRLESWKEIAAERDKVLAEAKKRKIDLTKIDGMEDILDTDKFLDADAAVRKRLIAKVKSYFSAKEKNLEPEWKNARKYLVSLTVGDEPCLHRSKVGMWLKRIFDKAKTAEDVEAHLEELSPLVANWKEVAAKYDVLHKNGLPPSFKAASRERFLSWHYDKRVAYTDELQNAQAAADERESTALAEEKKGIRYDMSVEDFEEAEGKLLPLLIQYPGDPDLQSMERYLALHRKPPLRIAAEENENEKAQLQAEIEQKLSIFPASLRWMYREAAEGGPAMLRRLNQVYYNRIWAKQNGYTDQRDEAEHAESDVNKMNSERYVRHGHTRGFERIVMEGETAQHAAIRDECKQTQVLYVASGDCRSVVDKVRSNAHNESFGYWTTLVLTDVSYDVQATVVKNLQRPLLSSLRRLHALGGRYHSGAVHEETKKAA